MNRSASRRPLPALRLLVTALLSALALASCGRSLTAPATPDHAGSPDVAGQYRGGDIQNQVVVTLAHGAQASDLAADHGALLLEYEAEERSALFAPANGQTPEALSAALNADPRVVTCEGNGWLESAEARQQSFAFDDGAGSAQTYLEQAAAAAIRLPQAHEVADGNGVVVAILDTGLDTKHPAFRWTYAGGVDFVDHDDDPRDVADLSDNDLDGRVDEAFGHGTHVAGIVHMVAPAARILAVRVLDSEGRGDILHVAAGVRWAVAHGAKVINLSLGTLGSSDALQDALEAAEDAGVSVVSSAGNWGADTPVEFPARSSHVAAIAAVDASAAPAAFSSYGHIIALAAPGVGVRSTYPGGGYRLWSGTSMSAPFVAGTMALLAQSHPEWSFDQMLQRIASTTRSVTSETDDFGAGMLDAGAALAPDRRSHVDDVPPPEIIRQR